MFCREFCNCLIHFFFLIIPGRIQVMALIFILFFAKLIVILCGSFYLDGNNWMQHITCSDPDYYFFFWSSLQSLFFPMWAVVSLQWVPALDAETDVRSTSCSLPTRAECQSQGLAGYCVSHQLFVKSLTAEAPLCVVSAAQPLRPPHAFFSRCSILPFRYSIYTYTSGIFGKNIYAYITN